MVNTGWIHSALDKLEFIKIEHANYRQTKRRIAAACRAMLPGELLVLVGPSRVGKTRCVRDALLIPDTNAPDEMGRMRVVVVEVGNEATSGEFSTKDFAMACLKAIHHPIYGVPAEDDPWGRRLNELLDRTPERRLWSSFSSALELRKTEYLVFDEAHHVLYVRGGDTAAARILDSWKCLGNSTRVKLVLTGSYSLLSLLTLAPHLLGRQQPLEFPRYRSDSKQDMQAWEQLLRSFSEQLKFKKGESLSTWNRLLFEGSLGRVGGLSLWVRTALAMMEAEGRYEVDSNVLEQTRLPAMQEIAILDEIVEGERNLIRHRSSLPATATTKTEEPRNISKDKEKRKNTPFRKKPRRNAVNGRA